MELYHHGVKGQKWGVRRYQYADGSLTPEGKKRRRVSQKSSKVDRVTSMMSMEVKQLVNKSRTQITGKQYVDGYLKTNTEFSRIQTSQKFEKHAFYATYKKSDMDKYMGLFGKNLISRADTDNIKVYQVKLSSTKKLKIPSDANASDITAKLLKEKDFKDNLVASIEDSKEKMRRPSQQILFKQAQNALQKDPDRLSSSEKVAIYKAFNLSLVHHNAQEIAAQNRFYGELKKKGYNAILDYNDKEYSSYHAKRPMIVFDVDSVKLQSIAETNPKVVNSLYRKYNAERVSKEVIYNTLGLVDKLGTKTVSECSSYMNRKVDDYLTR